MRLRHTVAALVTPALVLITGTAAHAAKPAPVHCGQIITTSIKVANDLRNCPRHGLVIGAPNITVALNGHTIDGDGAPFEPCPEDEPCDVGIANSGLED